MDEQNQDSESELKSIVESAGKELDTRAKESLAVLFYKQYHIFIADLYDEDGKLGVDYTTFPVVQSEDLYELEMFIKDQICN